MKNLLRVVRAARATWTALGLLAALAVSAHWIGSFRLPSPERSAARIFRVTTGADGGPGSLREALLAAARADRRARILIDVKTIVLETSLPPVLNPAGTVLESTHAAAIDASHLAEGPVLDLDAPNCVVLGVRVERAAGQAVLVRKPGARLRDMAIANSGVAVYQLDRATDLRIENVLFERNATGVQLSPSAGGTTLVNNQFRDHGRAAVWAVAANALEAGQPLEIRRNQFRNDVQAVVLFNVDAIVEGNTFDGARGPAVLVSGRRAWIRQNRMRSGRSFGIYAERMDHGVIAGNELDHNCAGGILVRASHGTDVNANRVYTNGYGIVLIEGDIASPDRISDNLIAQHVEDAVYVIGGSPVLHGNRLLQNRKVGVRLSSLQTGGAVLIPSPLLSRNVIVGNGENEIRRDQYQPGGSAIASPEPSECSWRTGNVAIASASGGGGR